MKTLILIATLALGISAQAATPTPRQFVDAIRESKEYRALEAKYQKVGGSFTCSHFVTKAQFRLPSKVRNVNKDVNYIAADCVTNPNDNLDPYQQVLLATVTVIVSEGDIGWEVVSVAAVTPPQPD